MRLLSSLTVLMIIIFIMGCNASSDPSNVADFVTMQLLHSNDLVGYLTPCG